jgi:hypothetical protein
LSIYNRRLIQMWNGNLMNGPNWAGNKNGGIGPTGATGPIGPTGPQGTPGLSSGAIYYFNKSVPSGVSTYDEMARIPLFNAGQDVTITTTGTIAEFITPINDPNVSLIPAGNWLFSAVLSLNVAYTTQLVRTSVWIRDTGGTETLIGQSSTDEVEVVNGTDESLYSWGVAIQQTSVATTDRIVVKFVGANLNPGDTLTMYFEGDNLAQVITSLSPNTAGPTGATGPIGPTGPAANAATWSQYPATQDVNIADHNLSNVAAVLNDGPINIQSTNNDIAVSAETIDVVADEAALISAFSDINLTAQNGNRGRVNITANPGYNNGVGGEIRLKAEGGVSPLGGGSGGLIELTATTPSLPAPSLTSAIRMSAQSILSYAGSVSPFASLAGYNYIQGLLGVEIAAGTLPVLPAAVPGSIYLYGRAGDLLPAGTRVQNGLGADRIRPLDSGGLVVGGTPAWSCDLDPTVR